MQFFQRMPSGDAVYVWVVVALNSAGWLTRIGPPLRTARRRPAFAALA
jgi:hypothetical protein